MKLSFRACLLTASLMTAALVSRGAGAGAPSSTDRAFVHKVGLGGMFEVDSSKIAQDKGTSQDVKDFSANEVKDHTQVNDELKSIATAQGIDLPAQRNAMFQKMIDSLNATSGPAFDALYLKDMKMIHDKDEAAFQKEAQSTEDPDLKAFAGKTAKIVQGHLMMLQDIKAKTK